MAERKAFPLRLSQDLYDELRRWAEQEFRSVNGQIEFLLREAVEQRCKTRRHHGTKGTDTDDQAERRLRR